MFIPDPGYAIVDCDLERADAQVVAWDAGDEELKRLFREGLDIHTHNAASVFRIPVEQVTGYQRQQAKQGVHATNYGTSAKTLSEETGMSISEATYFIQAWLTAHPAIKEWQDRIEHDLNKTRTIRNAFGYKRHFFDRIDVKKFHEALAWIPQSTVAISTNLGLINIAEQLPQVQLLIQVHDSLVMQVPISELPDIAEEIIKLMRVEVPYDDPLTIPVSYAISELSWGDIVTPKEATEILENPKKLTEHQLSREHSISEEMVKRVFEVPELYGAKA